MRHKDIRDVNFWSCFGIFASFGGSWDRESPWTWGGQEGFS